MGDNDTDVAWEKFGQDDPYFGVITDERFRKHNLTEEAKKAFFATGYEYIDDVMDRIRRHLRQDFAVNRALDFGCGVGRLVVPLAKIAREVTGMDVSDSMLREARKNCERLDNVVLVKSDNGLSKLDGKFDLIHSYIVFQHIPVVRGEQILKHLIDRLEDDGVCVLHFTYDKTTFLLKLVRTLKRHVPYFSNFINLAKGWSFFSPQMQMNDYDLNRIFSMMQKANVRDCYSEFTNHAGHLGVTVFFQKPGR